MAYSFVNGRDIILSIDWDNNGSFFPVACLTSVSMDVKRDAIDADSKCGDNQLPGDSVMQTISVSGNAIDQTGTIDRESYERLYSLLQSKATFAAKFGPALLVSGDILYTGNIFITSLKLDAKDKDLMKFDAEFGVVNAPLTQTKTY
jgi:predicted secreted protein